MLVPTQGLDPVAAVPLPDAERLAALRRMKLVATGMLLVAAVVYIASLVLGDHKGVWGYVGAAAEASMVGGLADLFAVTALFRHPLRIPIPHTAIIPKKKDQIGEGLATFVQRHFLTPSVVGEHLAAAQLPSRLGSWLAVPHNATRVAEELTTTLTGIARAAQDEELREAVARFVERWLRGYNAAPLASQAALALVDSGQHQRTLSSAIRAVLRFMDDNRAVFRRQLGEKLPGWLPEWVDDQLFQRGFRAVERMLREVLDDPQHEMRILYDQQMRAFGHSLATDPDKIARIDEAKRNLLDHPDMKLWLLELWGYVKEALVSDASHPSSEFRQAAERMLIRFGEALRDDPRVQARAETLVQRVAGYVVEHYGEHFGNMISKTIANWDATETSRRMELQVGRDLQFIRINGTVIGGLAGLIIYTLSQLL